MDAEHRFDCGDVGRSRRRDGRTTSLRSAGSGANVSVGLGNLVQRLGEPLPDRLVDLIEIAAYVAAADARVSRGRPDDNDVGAGWRRQFVLRIAVRDAGFWGSPTVNAALSDALAFVSDDDFSFRFEPSRSPASAVPRGYGAPSAAQTFRLERVIAFSGGLDSFAGAVESTLGHGKRVGLFSVRSGGTKLGPTQDHLARALDEAVREGETTAAVHSFSLTTSRAGAELGRERSQRTRSFFIAAAGAAIASSCGLDDLHFYENGVVSLNLPISAELVGARASRTTHPRTLQRLAALMSLVLGRPFAIQNPFLFCTKADVVRVIARHGMSWEIARTISCGDTVHMESAAPHCGLCSQCIDRRLGVLAAGCERDDPAAGYRADVLRAARSGAHLTVAEGYYRRARHIRASDERTFFAEFGEAVRALGSSGARRADDARRLYDLHVRHAAEVYGALDAARARDAKALPPTSLLGLFAGSEAPRRRRARVGAGTDVVRILHVSDTHFSTAKLGQSEVLEELCRDVRTRRERNEIAPDVVVFSGDIADRGTATEYALAETWLGEGLLPAAGLRSENLVVVPGNHDVNRSRIDPLARDLRQKILSEEHRPQELLRDAFERPHQRTIVLDPLREFVEFARRVEPRRATSDLPWTRARVRVRGRTISIAGISTACFSHDDDDDGKLMIGLHQILQLFPNEPSDLTIGVFHHPLRFLAEFDEREVAPWLRERCALLLQGHRHDEDAVDELRPAGGIVTVVAGAAFAAVDHPNRYHMLEWDFAAHRVRIQSRYWRKARWVTDYNAFGVKTDRHGYAQIKLAARKAR